MRRLVTLGVSSLLVGLAFTACGDDEDGGNGTGARGGSAGNGGGAGAPIGGSAGMGGSSGGTSGAGGSGGGGPALCSGCAQITVPTTGASQSAGFVFNLGAANLADFSNAVVTWKIKIPVANQGATLFLQPFAQDAEYDGDYNPYLNLTAANFAADTWVDVSRNFADVVGPVVGDAGAADGGADAAPPPAPTGFDKTRIVQFGLNVGSDMAATAPATAIVLIDSVTITGATGVANKEFTTGVDTLTLNRYNGDTVPEGTAVVANP